ncbi:hypothetical protein NMG60_11036623 [Bertholletia excelsa]
MDGRDGPGEGIDGQYLLKLQIFEAWSYKSKMMADLLIAYFLLNQPKSLVGAGFRTFRGNKSIERGESIKSDTEKAIKDSRCSIIIFSRDCHFQVVPG